MRFRMHGGFKKDERASFDVESADGAVLLSSDRFPGREACMDAIRAALLLLLDAEHFDVVARDDGFALVLQGDEGQKLAESALLGTENDAYALRERIVTSANGQESYDVLMEQHEETSVPFRWEATLDFGTLYDFSFASRSGGPGFESFFREDKKQHYFHVNGPNGEALLYSRGFGTGARRDQRLRAVAEGVKSLQRFEKHDADGLRFILKARNGQEIARSRAFASETERDVGMQWVHRNAAAFAEEHLRRHAGRVAGRDKYRMELRGRSGKPGFEAFRHEEDKQHYFIFHDDDGEPLLYSQGYQGKEGRDNGIRALIKNGIDADKLHLADEAGKPYFVVRAANHQAIARSRVFERADDAQQAMVRIAQRLPEWAGAYGVVLKTKAELQAVRAEARKASLTLSLERPKSIAPPPAPAAVVEETPAIASAVEVPVAIATAPIIAAIAPEFAPEIVPEIAPPAPPIVPEVPAIEPLTVEPLAFSEFTATEQVVEPPAPVVVPMPAPMPAPLPAPLPAPVVAAPVVVPAPPIAMAPISSRSAPIVPSKPAIVAPKPITLPPQKREDRAAQDALAFLRESAAKASASAKASALPLVSTPVPLPAPKIEEKPSAVIVPAPAIVAPVKVEEERPAAIAPAPAPVIAMPAPVRATSAKVEEERPAAIAPAPAPVIVAPPNIESPAPAPPPPAAMPAPRPTVPLASEQVAPQTAATNPPKNSKWVWLVPILLLVAIFCLVWCQPTKLDTTPAIVTTIPSASVPVQSAVPFAPSSVDIPAAACEHDDAGVPNTPEPSVASASDEPLSGEHVAPSTTHQHLVFPPGTMEAELAAFLADPKATVPRTFRMNGLRYPSNSHEVNDAGQVQVIAIGKILAAYPNVRIRIVGHRDSTEQEHYTGPNPVDDFPLSKIRAHCIYRRLRAQKVLESRMEFLGENASNPIASDETVEGRQDNRRIDIIVVQR